MIAFTVLLHRVESNALSGNLVVFFYRGIVGVAILLGLTWIFAVFAIDQASVVFYYLFAIFNSLQVSELIRVCYQFI